MNKMDVIYVPGETSLECVLVDGKTAPLYINGVQKGEPETVEEYAERRALEDYVIVTFEEASRLIDEACEELYCFDWKEIDEERYEEMLGVLPPEMFWNNGVTDMQIWRLCEYMSYDITNHFAHYNGRYYEAMLRCEPTMEKHAASLRAKFGGTA